MPGIRPFLAALCLLSAGIFTGLTRGAVEDISARCEERQLTQSRQGHVLTNFSVWSPDGQWLVYDLRMTPGKFDGTRIERVNVRTGEVQCLYESRHGAACGVAAYHPLEPKVAFIHGPENPAPDWTYGASRRRGAIVDDRKPGTAQALDAMNYAPPFAPGALRGGSHVHIFSGDGERVSFTYDDEILSRLGEAESGQRNVGVAVSGRPVTVNRNHPRNNDGNFFSTVVTRTVPRPRPGSNEISRACEEGWIGRHGYLRTDGSRQRYALAFQGLVTAKDGSRHYEVFVADLPADMTRPGDAPLEGTLTQRPAPPRGTVQRRLTFTGGQKFPGIQGPRHWLRSSPDGAHLAFLMKDEEDIVQFWTISPNGGTPRQVTRNPWSAASAFTWSPDGKLLAYVMDNSVFISEVSSGKAFRLTARSPDASAPQATACVFSPDGKSIAYTRRQPEGTDQIFTVSSPPDLLTAERTKPSPP